MNSCEPSRNHALSDIAVVGSIILDLSIFTEHLPKPGETLTGTRFILGHGGKGANQAVMAKLLGASVTLIGKVGKDAFGMDYIQDLKARNISTYHVYVTDQASTGVAQITVTGTGQNSIIVVPGANMLLTEDDVAKAAYSIRSAKVVLCQLEVDLSAIRFSMKTAFEKDVFTMLNTAPIPEGFSLEDEIFGWANLVCANETEAGLLAQIPVCETVEHAKYCATLIQKRSSNIKWIIITLGSQGVYVLESETNIGTHIAAPDIEAVDSTGAGDAFMGAVAYYYACHNSINMLEIIRRSCHIAADTVTRIGTQISYLPRADMDTKLFD